MKTVFVLAFILISSHSLTADLEMVCRGGDGPHPFIDITNQLPKDAVRIPSYGNVSEFIYWSNKNAIVYRNQENKLYQIQLKSFDQYYKKELYSRMSRLVDPAERYIMTEENNWYMDTEDSSPTWEHFKSDYPLSHLFWHRDLFSKYFLFSLSNIKTSQGYQKLRISMNRPGQSNPTLCDPGVGQGEVYKIGEGHRYPDAVLYRSSGTLKNRKLTVSTIQVRTIPLNGSICSLSRQREYTLSAQEIVRSVHRFPNQNIYAYISEDYGTKKLHWNSPSGNKTCELNGLEPMFLNHETSRFLVWSPSSGLHMVDLENGVKAQVLPRFTTAPITKEQIFMSNDGKWLFLAPTILSGQRKLMYYPLSK